MENDLEFPARDHREPGWFWVENEILEYFIPAIGVYGFAVYGSLAKHANSSGECYPAIPTIAKELDCSENSVRKSLALLFELGLISIEERKSCNNKRLSNCYTLHNVKAIIESAIMVYPSPDEGVEVHGVNPSVPSTPSPDEPELDNTNKTNDNKTKDITEAVTKPLTEWQQRIRDFAIPLCKMANLDYELPINKRAAGQVSAVLLKAGYTPDQISLFEKQWYSRDYPGGKTDGKPPSLKTAEKYFGWVKEESYQSTAMTAQKLYDPADLERAIRERAAS